MRSSEELEEIRQEQGDVVPVVFRELALKTEHEDEGMRPPNTADDEDLQLGGAVVDASGWRTLEQPQSRLDATADLVPFPVLPSPVWTTFLSSSPSFTHPLFPQIRFLVGIARRPQAL